MEAYMVSSFLESFLWFFEYEQVTFVELRQSVECLIRRKDELPGFYYACFLDFCVRKLSYHIYDEMEREDSPLFNEYRKCFGYDDDRYLATLVEVDGFSEEEFRKYFTKAKKLWVEYGDSAMSHFIMMWM